MIIENPGLKIRVLREIKGYTQENMAVELGISAKAYQKIESGETQLNISRLNQISVILEMAVIDILRFEADFIFDKKNLKSEKPATLESKNAQYDNSLIKVQENQIESLKAEIGFLRKIIAKNLDL